MLEVMVIIGSYLLGSISSAIIVCKVMGLSDPREAGSGNPGATNVKRLYGLKPAGVTLVGDILKGLLPVLIAHQLEFSALIIALVGFSAFVGHLFPIFFQFKGGKGVATMLGVMFGLSLPIGLAVAMTWLFVAKVLKISSVSALVATALAPVYIFFLSGEVNWVVLTLLMTVILFWRHKSNIKDLLAEKKEKKVS